MKTHHNIRNFEIGAYKVSVFVVDYHCATEWLTDLFDIRDSHEGGVTIRNPVNPGDNRLYQWFAPTQYTLASLASDYAKQGRSNPSKEAYKSAQQELAWHLTASDFGISVTVHKHGIEIANTTAGFGFDYSFEYADQSLEQYVLANFLGVIRECLRDAVIEARDNIKLLAA
jgi:hypothetical protein